MALIMGIMGTPAMPPCWLSSPLSVAPKSSLSSSSSPEDCMESCSPVLSTKLKPRCSSGSSGRSKSRDICLKLSTASMMVAGGLKVMVGSRISFMRWMMVCSCARSGSSPSAFLTVVALISSNLRALGAYTGRQALSTSAIMPSRAAVNSWPRTSARLAMMARRRRMASWL